MTPNSPATNPSTSQIPFKAETRQLLDILIHSLYTDRDIFLRELISNASDALTRVNFEILTNRNVLNPESELGIWIIPDEEAGTLTVKDTGIGMTAGEMDDDLGTIAHSGARAFVEAVQEQEQPLSEIIGQFGVGFYSAFMVAEWIRVASRSYQPDEAGAEWYSDGSDTYTLGPSQKGTRGTDVIIKLKEDSQDYLQEYKLREIVRKHSDFVAFPIYIGDGKEQINRQTALWRQQPAEVEDQDYDEFYRQLTLDPNSPMAHTHMAVDAPVQMYAVLYVPSDPELGLFSARKEPGLKLYSKKILIQEYSKALLPDYLNFVQGVVDSEDLPLNVSRETVQVSRVMANLKKLVTSKALDMIRGIGEDDDNEYTSFWETYSQKIKQGIATEISDPIKLYPLLRFNTSAQPDGWTSLDDYVGRIKPNQEDIYYILGDDTQSALASPHLDILKHYDYEVLLLTDQLDPFMMVKLTEYENHPFTNVATAELELPESEVDTQGGKEGLTEDANIEVVDRFKSILGEKVSDVRISRRLTGSPARLVDKEGETQQELQRVYRMIDKDYEAPKKVLEINPSHPLILKFSKMATEDPLTEIIVEQIYENALLVEGLHPEPASMVARIQRLMEKVLE